MFLFQRGAKGKNLAEGKRIAVHLSGRLRQLMRLVHNENMMILEQRPALLLAAHGVGKKIIVVADLNMKFIAFGRGKMLLVTTAVIAWTMRGTQRGNTHLRTVESGQTGCLI